MSGYKKDQLTQVLAALDLPVSGTKPVLLERLKKAICEEAAPGPVEKKPRAPRKKRTASPKKDMASPVPADDLQGAFMALQQQKPEWLEKVIDTEYPFVIPREEEFSDLWYMVEKSSKYSKICFCSMNGIRILLAFAFTNKNDKWNPVERLGIFATIGDAYVTLQLPGQHKTKFVKGTEFKAGTYLKVLVPYKSQADPATFDTFKNTVVSVLGSVKSGTFKAMAERVQQIANEKFLDRVLYYYAPKLDQSMEGKYTVSRKYPFPLTFTTPKGLTAAFHKDEDNYFRVENDKYEIRLYENETMRRFNEIKFDKGTKFSSKTIDKMWSIGYNAYSKHLGPGFTIREEYILFVNDGSFTLDSHFDLDS